jgi:lipoprotein-anchoring transpeptidase ErfK/SrfK
MTVYKNGFKRYSWKVSTARRGKVTPRGTWKAKWLSRHHKSSRYRGAPMPYSIFYSGNFAVHGTNHIKKLGRPASAGCVRLHPKNAAVLFQMVKNSGLRNTIVKVVN